MASDLGPEARFIFRTFAVAGYECFLVGGSVRDRLLHRADADLDFTTNARPDEMLRLFPGSHYPNRFGTVLVNLSGRQYEITTYRGEGRYSDHRHPDQIAFVDRLEDDLGRRDFTVNAMAMDAGGRIVDPFDGHADLERRLLRAVGEPAERLAEDPLRMMRAVRLAAQLDFRIERRTRLAVERDGRLLALISRERIRDELMKLLVSRRALWGYDLVDRLGLLPAVLPELAAMSPGACRHARQTLRFARGNALLRLAALLHVLEEHDATLPSGEEGRRGGNGRSALRRALEHLRLSSADQQQVERLVSGLAILPLDVLPQPATARRLLSRFGSLLNDAVELVRAHRLASGPCTEAGLAPLRRLAQLGEQARRSGVPLRIGDLQVRGEDLMVTLDLAPGPAVGRLLAVLLDRVLDDPALNRRDMLLDLAAGVAADLG